MYYVKKHSHQLFTKLQLLTFAKVAYGFFQNYYILYYITIYYILNINKKHIS